MTARPIRVLCVDDHAFLVEGLEARMEAEPDLEFAGRLPRADDLVGAVKRLHADIVLLDIEMPGLDPFEALRDLARQCRQVRAIMLSAYVRDHYIDAAYKAGAWGYLSKNDSPELVIAGIRDVVRGRVASSPEVLKRSQTEPARPCRRPAEPTKSKLDSITNRELEVLRMIARGRSRKEIAEQLSRSPMTIDNHRKSIMRKLGFTDRGELIRFAIAEGLVEV